jgi:hypothetical protein
MLTSVTMTSFIHCIEEHPRLKSKRLCLFQNPLAISTSQITYQYLVPPNTQKICPHTHHKL